MKPILSNPLILKMTMVLNRANAFPVRPEIIGISPIEGEFQVFNLVQPITSREARGLSDLGQPITSSEARGSRDLGQLSPRAK